MGRPSRKNTEKSKKSVGKNSGTKTKSVKQILSFEFAHNKNQCFKANPITIKEEYYFGFIKCWLVKGKYIHSRSRLLMPINAWKSFFVDVLPTFKMTLPDKKYDGIFLKQLFLFNNRIHGLSYFSTKGL